MHVSALSKCSFKRVRAKALMLRFCVIDFKFLGFLALSGEKRVKIKYELLAICNLRQVKLQQFLK